MAKSDYELQCAQTIMFCNCRCAADQARCRWCLARSNQDFFGGEPSTTLARSASWRAPPTSVAGSKKVLYGRELPTNLARFHQVFNGKQPPTSVARSKQVLDGREPSTNLARSNQVCNGREPSPSSTFTTTIISLEGEEEECGLCTDRWVLYLLLVVLVDISIVSSVKLLETCCWVDVDIVFSAFVVCDASWWWCSWYWQQVCCSCWQTVGVTAPSQL